MFYGMCKDSKPFKRFESENLWIYIKNLFSFIKESLAQIKKSCWLAKYPPQLYLDHLELFLVELLEGTINSLLSVTFFQPPTLEKIPIQMTKQKFQDEIYFLAIANKISIKSG